LNVPIVYQSGESGLDQQMAAMRVGGDDFLHKPIEDAHLISAVSIRVERLRTLSSLMSRDSLTGLLNHISLKLALEAELERARRSGSNTTLVMIDIDHFKSVNDRFGHPAGDSVIKGLARMLTQRLRKSDLIGRYGGEEFAVVMRDTDAAQANAPVEEMRRRFAEIGHAYGNERFQVSFSAGIASAPPHAGVEALLNAADQALYDAKRGGRNRVVIAPGAESVPAAAQDAPAAGR
jgi:diguanylate cyclase (GGDEF)-like protein